MRRFEVRTRQDLRIEGLVHVLALKALAVYLVELVELPVRLGFERREGPDRLRGERAAVDEEEDSFANTGFEKPIHLVHERPGLPGAGRHRDEHLALPVCDRLLDRRAGLDLVRPEPRRMQARVFGKPVAAEGRSAGGPRSGMSIGTSGCLQRLVSLRTPTRDSSAT